MQAYLDLLRHVYMNGVEKDDRTGTGTKSIFGHQLRFDLSQSFPAVTTKKLFWKGVVAELLWFLKGSQDALWLQELGVKIWDEWAKGPSAWLGPVYGKQWRSWDDGNRDPVDQIAQVIETIKTNPNSRRMLVSAWNVTDLPYMALAPCHVLFQFYVTPEQKCGPCMGSGTTGGPMLRWVNPCKHCDGTGRINAKLSCQLYQRSADLFLGVPFNIASYALLTHMIAQVCDLKVGEFIHTFGDAHIYLNHLSQVEEQLSREPRSLPKLWINPEIKDIDGFSLDDFRLDGYDPHPAISAPVAV